MSDGCINVIGYCIYDDCHVDLEGWDKTKLLTVDIQYRILYHP